MLLVLNVAVGIVLIFTAFVFAAHGRPAVSGKDPDHSLDILH